MKQIKKTKAFLLGNPRSGTSLLRIMLNAHPDIISPPESGFAHWWFTKYKDWCDEDFNNNRVESFVNDLLSSKKIETWSLKKEYLIKHIYEKKPIDYSSLVELVYNSYTLNNNTVKAIVDKNNYYVNHLAELKQIWPDAKYIHLIRDGRDVACSYLEINKLDTKSKYKPILPTDLNTIAREWIKNNHNIGQLKKLGKNRYFLIRYEDLILNTDEVLKNLCEFLNVKYNDEMLQYFTKKNEKNIEPLETIDWKLKTKQKPDKTNIGKYINYLDSNEIEKFNKIAFSMLEKYSYV